MTNASPNPATVNPPGSAPIPPAPALESPSWLRSISGFFGENPDQRWSERFLEASSDMMLVCDENLEILFHNRSFLRSLGHSDGTYVGFSLLDFIPDSDRNEAERTFDQLVHGNHHGMRVKAPILTRTGSTPMEARITRTRRDHERCFLYMTIRTEFERTEAENETGGIFAELPAAWFRTDGKLNVVEASGRFWTQLGIDPQRIVGAQLSDSKCPITPGFLHQIDYCDTMAGQTLQCETEWGERTLVVSVEPFVDSTCGGRILGAVGIVREAKSSLHGSNAHHLAFPRPEEFTSRQRTVPHTAPKSTERAVDPTAPIPGLRVAVQPRSMTPQPSAHSTESVALAN